MKAFLSHSSRDKPVVEEVAAHLGAAQVEIDSTTFDSGILNVDAIQAALKRTSIYVLFLTTDALRSSYVRFEAILAQELVARGIIERFFVICLDAQAFSKADEQWKSYSFVRHLTAPQPIARFIQNQLLIARARAGLKNQPYVERSKEQNDLKELLVQPSALPTKGIYISGNEGIGRRTFVLHVYKDRYPSVNGVFADIQIDSLDGYEEIYRKLSQELLPNWPLSAWRARVIGFSLGSVPIGAVEFVTQL